MQRAFICLLDIGSDTDFASIATELQDDITQAGYNVIYVHPWNAETVALNAPLPGTLPTTPPLGPLPPPPPAFPPSQTF